MKKPSLGTIGALIAGAATIVAPSFAINVKAGPAQTAALPLVVCSTTSGVASAPKHLPATQEVTVPLALSRELAAYSDNQGELYLVAPRGWACQASLGADGSDSITVYPRGEVSSSQFGEKRTWPRSAKAVTGDLIPVCYGCYLDQACTFFPEAEHDLLKAYGNVLACPRRPAREGVSRISATVVAFEDPPGAHGTGNPSGGDYPANGVVTFKEGSATASYGSAMGTCTLPANDHALCTAVLDAFVSSWDTYSRA